MTQPASAPNKPWGPATCPATQPTAAPSRHPPACIGPEVNPAASAMAKAAGIRIDFKESPFYRAEWRSGREFPESMENEKSDDQNRNGNTEKPDKVRISSSLLL